MQKFDLDLQKMWEKVFTISDEDFTPPKPPVVPGAPVGAKTADLLNTSAQFSADVVRFLK